MTETHSFGEWEDIFREKLTFRAESGERRFLVFPDAMEDFIRQTQKEALLAQKEGFRREIEGMKTIGSSGDDMVHRNEPLDDLLTKLDTNGI